MHREEEKERKREGEERRKRNPAGHSSPTLRNKNSLYGQLLLRPPRFFCIPFVPRHSGFQSVQRIHSLPMVSSGIPRFPFLSLSLFLFFPSFLLLSFLPSDNFFHSLLLLLSLSRPLFPSFLLSLPLFIPSLLFYIYIYPTGKLKRKRKRKRECS